MASEPSFLEKVEALPEERKRAVQHWFGTQMFIAKELGLDPDDWFGYLDWALQNPLDFSFLFQRPKGRGPGPSDDELKAAKAVLGAVTGTKMPGKGGPGNLVGFMASKDKDQKK